MQLFCGKERGAISVFLTLILVPVLIFCGIIVDASRLYASKTVVSGAGNLTMNAALSQYDKKLKDSYGLIAMKKSPGDASVLGTLETYFKESCNAKNLAGSDTDNLHSMFQLELTKDGLSASGVEGSALSETNVLKQQILEYMKFRGPVYIVSEVIEKFQKLPLKNTKEKKEYVDKKTKYGKAVSKLGKPLKKSKDAIDAQCAAIDGMTTGLDETWNQINTDYNMAMLFQLAACSMQCYLNGTASIPIGGDEVEVRQIQEWLALDVNWSESESVFNEKKYRDMIASTAVFLVSDITDENCGEGTEEKVKKLEQKLNQSIRNMGIIRDNYIKDAEGKFDTLLQQTKEAIKSGKEALDNLKELKKTWENKVVKAKNEYDDAKTTLINTGETLTEDSEETELFDQIKAEDIEDMQEKVKTNNEALGLLQDNFNNIKAELKQVKKVEVGSDEASWIYDFGAEAAVQKFETSRNLYLSGVEERSFIDLKNLNLYKNGLSKIDEDAQKDKAQEQEQKDNQKKADDTQFDKIKKTIETAAIDLRKNANGMNYPADFPSGIDQANRSDTNNLMKNVTVQDDTENIDGSMGNIDVISTLIEGLDKLSETVLEGAYLMEYMSEMFSCLTTETAVQAKTASDTKSLSGDDLTTHFIANGEVEYILYGDPSIGANQLYAVSSIYGIRFALDTIWVFMDTTSNNEATAVATSLSAGQAWLFPIIKYGYMLCKSMIYAGEEVGQLLSGEESVFWKGKDDIKFTYKEYLKMFLLLGMIGGSQKDYILRLGDCIQLNMGSTLKDKYTMVSLKAEVGTSTTFLPKVPAFLGKESTDDGKRIISYNGILAY